MNTPKKKELWKYLKFIRSAPYWLVYVLQWWWASYCSLILSPCWNDRSFWWLLLSPFSRLVLLIHLHIESDLLLQSLQFKWIILFCSYWYNFDSSSWSTVYKHTVGKDLKFKAGYDSEVRLGWASLWVISLSYRHHLSIRKTANNYLEKAKIEKLKIFVWDIFGVGNYLNKLKLGGPKMGSGGITFHDYIMPPQIKARVISPAPEKLYYKAWSSRLCVNALLGALHCIYIIRSRERHAWSISPTPCLLIWI